MLLPMPMSVQPVLGEALRGGCNPEEYAPIYAWYEADEITGLLDGVSVSTWTAHTGSNLTAVTAPTYVVATPAVAFTSTSRMTTPVWTTTGVDVQWDIALAMRGSNKSQRQTLWSFGHESTTAFVADAATMLVVQETTGYIGFYTPTLGTFNDIYVWSTKDVMDGTPHSIIASHDALFGLTYLYVDNVLLLSSNQVSHPWATNADLNFYVGDSPVSSSFTADGGVGFTGSLLELIVYTRGDTLVNIYPPPSDSLAIHCISSYLGRWGCAY